MQPTAPAAPAAPAAQAAPAAPGAPVEESAVTATDVLAAVDRAGELGAEPATSGLGPADDHAAPAAAEPVGHRPPIAVPDEMPSAGPIPDAVALPATPAAPAPADDRVLVSASHPMAALYMQTPMPPDMRGNRGAGVLISVLATLVFALLFGAVLLFWAGGPAQPVPVLMQTGLWPLAAAAAAFFVGMALLVLIVGRAGWWAYVLGGFFVGVLVWLATIAGVTYSVILISGTTGLTQIVTGGAPGAGVTVLGLIAFYGLQIPAIAAGVIAREVTVWFGAWIGARGRRMSRSNAEALAEYEASLAEAQAKQLP
ncbi:MAG: hypothetical protein KDB25_01665 [Leucobacter sp.]|nr:hypothetical protein [Leucobacter sp.]